jgi:hypothetical protein
MEMYSFESPAGGWIPVGHCPSEEMALGLLAKEVGGSWSIVGSGDPSFWMMKTSTGWGRYSIPVYSA